VLLVLLPVWACVIEALCLFDGAYISATVALCQALFSNYFAVSKIVVLLGFLRGFWVSATRRGKYFRFFPAEF
jgi:hypothetical protein